MSAPAPHQPPSAPLAPPALTRVPRRTGGPTLTRRALEAPAPAPSLSHPLLAAEATAALGSITHLVHMPSSWWIVGGSLASVALGAAVKGRFVEQPPVMFAAGSGIAASAWLWNAAETTPWSLPSLALLGLGTITLGPIYSLLRWQTDKRNAKELAERMEVRAAAKRHEWVDILEKAGAKDITINRAANGDGWINGERSFPAGFSLALDLGDEAPDATSLAGKTPEIEKIASRRTKLPIRPGSIQIVPWKIAHQCEIIVPTRDVLEDTVEVPVREGPRSINDPIEVATAVDGSRLAWDCHKDPHGLFSGMTNSGKSTFLNAHAHETTRSTDCVTWMICGFKPVRSFAPWMAPFLEGVIDPYTGKPVNPVLDWIAPTEDEALKMLLDAYKAIDRRQASAGLTGLDRWYATPETPALVILVDESPDLLASTFKVQTHRGEWVTFADLLLKIKRLARSEDIHLITLTQRGTVSMMGGESGDMKSQISYRAGFHATGLVDANAVFNTQTIGIKVESLPQGALYLEMEGDSRPVLAKGDYMSQERIRQTAIEHAQYCGPLDAWTTEPDGKYLGLDFYGERWTRPEQQEFLKSLNPNAVRTIPGQPVVAPSSPVQPEVPADGNLMANFEQWMGAEHPAKAPTDELLQEYITDTWNKATPEDRKAFSIDAKAADIEGLDALYAADAFEPTQPAAEPVVNRVDPSLPKDTRDLLACLAASNLMYGDEPYVRALELLALAADELDWSNNSTVGGKRIVEALKAVNVFKLEPRPRAMVDGKMRQITAYSTADLRAALDSNIQ